MKKITCIIAVIVAALAMATPASAQFRWGPKVGMNVNTMHLSKDALADLQSSDNRTGFTGGLTCEFTVPLIGIGFDASVMYVHRITDNLGLDENAPKKFSSDYIQIPVNLKYKLGLPLISQIVTPYAFTGPSIAFLTNKQAVTDAWKRKAFDATWNLGIGVELFRKVQVGASYGWGLTKAMEIVSPIDHEKVNLGNLNGWTVTAAYFF